MTQDYAALKITLNSSHVGYCGRIPKVSEEGIAST